jgi:hypothetical protein
MMMEAGFRQGYFSTCVFYREQRKVRVVVYGDDLTVVGPGKS